MSLDTSDPAVIDAMLAVIDAARPILTWNERRAQIHLPGLQPALRQLASLEKEEPPTIPSGLPIAAPHKETT